MAFVQSLLDDAGFYTKLTIDPATARVSAIQLIDRNGQAKFTLNPINSKTAGLPVFQIRLFQFNLRQSRRTSTVFDYAIAGASSYTSVDTMQSSDSQQLKLHYTGVKPSNRLLKKNGAFIDVILTFTAAQKGPASGWIDLDIQFSSLPMMAEDKPYLGWELLLTYQQSTF